MLGNHILTNSGRNTVHCGETDAGATICKSVSPNTPDTACMLRRDHDYKPG